MKADSVSALVADYQLRAAESSLEENESNMTSHNSLPLNAAKDAAHL